MKEKHITTTEEFLDGIKKKTKLVSVNIKGKKIKLPIDYCPNAIEIYMNNYELTKDKKETFCIMLKNMTDSRKNLFKENKDVCNVTIENIKDIDDKDLKKIGEIIINQSKDLIVIYTECKETNFYDNFHKAIEYKYDKNMKELQTTSQNFIEPIKSLSMNNLFSTINEMKSITNNHKTSIDIMEELKFEPLKAEDIYTNVLLKKQIEADENIAKITLENQIENKNANDKAEKINKMNFKVVVATLIVTILSLIVAMGSLWVTIKK